MAKLIELTDLYWKLYRVFRCSQCTDILLVPIGDHLPVRCKRCNMVFETQGKQVA